MGVGRSTVRQAVRMPAHAGILEARQGAGTFVRATTSPSDFAIHAQRAAALGVYEVRRMEALTKDHSALHDKLALAIRQKDQHASITAVRRHLDVSYDALANLGNA